VGLDAGSIRLESTAGHIVFANQKSRALTGL
jgi:hypothetical protein